MSLLTDAQICFGVQFEGCEFPWFCSDIEEWWFEVNDFQLPNHNSLPEEEVRKLIENFKKQHPLPVEPVNYYLRGYSTFILAVPKTIIAATKKHPEIFRPENLKVSNGDVQELLQFCKRFKLKFKTGPAWFLSLRYY